VVLSPDGKRLASKEKVWDVLTGQELYRLGPPFGGWGLAFSPDGKRLARIQSSQSSTVVQVFDAETGKVLLTLSGGGKSLAFSPDGKRLASDEKVWDAQTGQERLSFKASADTVLQCVVAFSPDGHRLGRITATGEVTIWDATPLQAKP
jgi:WD40 repeat protein